MKGKFLQAAEAFKTFESFRRLKTK